MEHGSFIDELYMIYLFMFFYCSIATKKIQRVKTVKASKSSDKPHLQGVDVDPKQLQRCRENFQWLQREVSLTTAVGTGRVAGLIEDANPCR
jgi:hypothetical protein